METIINKIKNGVQLTGDEVEKAIWSFDQVKIISGDNRRWSRSCEVIIKVKGKLYSLEYDSGLTECQENEYFPQIAEEVKEIETNVKVKKFVSVDKIKQLSERDFFIEKSIQEFKEIEGDNKRLIKIAEEMIKEYNDKINQYNSIISTAEAELLSRIQTQVDIKEMKETKTEYNLKFPSAKVSISKDKTVLVKPDTNKCPDEFLKVSVSVDWINYKKNLKVENDKVIDITTGEVTEVETKLVKGGEVKIKINE